MSRGFAAQVYDVGPPMTFDNRLGSTTLAALIANRAYYGRVLHGGTITGITLSIGTSSGNISVAVYRSTGTGSAARPGTRIATTGAIACPATGEQTVSLGGSVTVQPGDWFAITADNATATFRRVQNAGITGPASVNCQQDTAHPLPATTGTLAASSNTILMVGA